MPGEDYILRPTHNKVARYTETLFNGLLLRPFSKITFCCKVVKVIEIYNILMFISSEFEAFSRTQLIINRMVKKAVKGAEERRLQK